MSGPLSPRTAYVTLNVPYNAIGASLAQLAEHALRKRMVAGQRPASTDMSAQPHGISHMVKAPCRTMASIA